MHQIIYTCLLVAAALWPIVVGDSIAYLGQNNQMLVRRMNLREFVLLVLMPSLLIYATGWLFHSPSLI